MNTRRMILIVAVLILFLPVLSWAGTVELPRTGQTECFDDNGTQVACDDTGQDGEGQAGVPWPSPRFTNADGTTRITGDVVLDQLTGLMWSRDADLPGGKKTWQDALTFVAGLNVGGHSDWRLPNVNELESLVNAEETNTATWLNDQGFTNVQGNVNDIYWSSTWRDVSMVDVFGIDMKEGMVGPSSIDLVTNYVWSVRAGQTNNSDPTFPANIWKTGQTKCYDDIGTEVACAGTGQDGESQAGVTWPATRFTNSDGTVPVTGNVVLDQLTGLMWLKDANCIMTQYPGFDNDIGAGDGKVFWQHALDFVSGINDGTFLDCGAGFTDWRLSNRKELRSLYNYEEPLPGGAQDNATWLNNQGFNKVIGANYWTSTTISNFSDNAWRMTLADEELAASTKDSDHHVWPVRAGVELGNADLSVTKTDSPDPVTVGDDLTYTVTVTNNGPDDATGVTLTDTLPAGVTFVSVVSSQGNCAEVSGTVTCNLGDLASGASATVTVVVTPTSVGDITNRAEVTGDQHDPDPVNNVDTAPTTVNQQQFTLTVTKSGTGAGTVTSSPVGIDCGTDCSEVYDSGKIVTLTAAPDAGSTFASWSGGGCSGTGACMLTINADTTITATFNQAPAQAQLTNISTRGIVRTGDDVMIAGLIIGGTDPKTVLIRARGPALADFGVPGVLANPLLQLFSGQTLIADNDNWETTTPLCQSSGLSCGDSAAISATQLDPCRPIPLPGQPPVPTGCSMESAILVTLNPGNYTAQVSGVPVNADSQADGETGVGLVEVFEVGTASTSKLTNISTRGVVGAGDDVMIGGFIIGGADPKTVLIRARGPALGDFGIAGVLVNPLLQLFNGNGALIADNDDWQTTTALCQGSGLNCGDAAAITATQLEPCRPIPLPGQPPTPTGCSQESAVLVTLPPGNYTAQVSGVGGGTGVGLVEVFEVNP